MSTSVHLNRLAIATDRARPLRQVVATCAGAALVLIMMLVPAVFAKAAVAPANYIRETTVALPGPGSGVAVDSARGRVYVADRNDDLLFVLDADSLSLIASIPVPNEPYIPVVDPATGYVYVSQYTGNALPGTVATVDPVAGTVLSTVAVGSSPVGLALDPVRHILYVANNAGPSINVLDVSNPALPVAVSTLPVADTETLTLNAAGDTLFVGEPSSNSMEVIDIASATVTATWTGLASAHQAVLSTDESLAFVSAQLASTASIVQVSSGTTQGSIPVANSYFQSVDRTKGHVFMTAPFNSGGQVAVLNADTGALLQTVPAAFAYYAATDPARQRTFVTAVVGNTLTVIAPAPAPPVVVTDPQDQTVNAGDTATFTASASGAPTPTVQWESSADQGGSWTPVSGAVSSTLTFDAATLDQNGLLVRAVFTNVSGSVTTAAARLTVLAADIAPVITSGPPPAGTIGVDYAFTVTATGDPVPTFAITAGALPAGLSLDPITGVISGKPTSAGTSTFTVTAQNRAGTDAREYTVVIAETVPTPGPTTPATTDPAPVSSSSPAATKDLAHTGGNLAGMALGAGVLVLGSGLLLGYRRRTSGQRA